jgi:hypothetical protein
MRNFTVHARTFIRQVAAIALVAVVTSPHAQSSPPPASESAAQQQPVVLDSVIAVVNGDVLLRSDLQTEMDLSAIQPLSLPGGKGLEQRAARRLINRTLIVQQMTNQGMLGEVTEDDVQKDLAELRKQIPACVRYQCQTAEGWARFLRDHNLTPDEVDRLWHVRMQILRFIDARFRSGIRISSAEIEDYYNKTFAPQFRAENATPPTLASVTSRIEEVLLQQRVTALLQDWLKSLRDQGNIVILDPALGKSHNGLDDSEEGDDQ